MRTTAEVQTASTWYRKIGIVFRKIGIVWEIMAMNVLFGVSNKDEKTYMKELMKAVSKDW